MPAKRNLRAQKRVEQLYRLHYPGIMKGTDYDSVFILALSDYCRGPSQSSLRRAADRIHPSQNSKVLYTCIVSTPSLMTLFLAKFIAQTRGKLHVYDIRNDRITNLVASFDIHESPPELEGFSVTCSGA